VNKEGLVIVATRRNPQDLSKVTMGATQFFLLSLYIGYSTSCSGHLAW